MKGTRVSDKGRTAILLKDLDPKREVRGGAGKTLFGEQEDTFEGPAERGEEPQLRRAKLRSTGQNE